MVTLRGLNGENIAGDFTVKFATVEGKEVPQVQSITKGSSIITVEAPNGGTFTPGKKCYIVALPQTLSSGLVIEGFKEDGTVYETTIAKSVTLKRAVFARKTNFDSGLTAQDLYDYTLTVTPPGVFPYTGGTHSWENPDPNKQGMRVASYRTLKSDPTKTFPVAWKSQISIDDGTTWNDLTEDNKSTYGAGWLTLFAYSNTPIGNSGADTDYIYFYVGKETIHQGNAVIAAYVGNTVAWSWHIWVTDQDMTSVPVKNYQNVIYNFLPVNLGWSGFTTTGIEAFTDSEFNIVSGTTFDKGFFFKTNVGDGSTFYPALGCRSSQEGEPFSCNKNGDYWSAVSSGTGYGYLLTFSETSYVVPLGEFVRGFGFIIRSVQEK